MNPYPILDFDGEPEAILEPGRILKRIDIAEQAVVCFFKEIIDRVIEDYQARVIFRLRSEMGSHPVYEIDYQGQRLVVVHPGVGAPLAAGLLEELIALGCRTFIAAGGAGVRRLYVMHPDGSEAHAIYPTDGTQGMPM